MTEDEIIRGYLEEYAPRLRWMAQALLRGEELRFVEDLAQEGWIAMWRQIKTGRSAEKFLIQAAKSRMQTCRRDWFTTGKSKANAPNGRDIPEQGFQQDLELMYHFGEIHTAINALTPREREYIFLRFWAFTGETGKGTPNPAIQSRFKSSNATAHWNSARAKLAEALEHLRGHCD
jgi:DNA-directed RNA polymerase specialized sigma24 family protein